MKRLLVYLFSCLTFACAANTYAQAIKDKDFYKQISNYDLSKIIIPEYITPEDAERNKENILRAEPIGFIGDDYQRFYIHFTAVTKDPNNPHQYLVKGKTKVRETVRTFSGKLKITSAAIRSNKTYPNYQCGYAMGTFQLFEDKKLSATGLLAGIFTSRFIIDDQKDFRYDALGFNSDRFNNNQFEGIWTSYRTKVAKKCNCGDYRIPESKKLDVGAAEFSPDFKYFNKGWKYLILAQSGETENEVNTGRKKENEKWWE